MSTEEALPPLGYGRQSIDDTDVEAVAQALRGDWLTQGPTISAFEQDFATYCGAAHCVAVNSGTAALHLAYEALGVGPGDVVLTTPISFVATANAARYCGADVDFVDVDETITLCPERLREKLEHHEGRVKLVVPVHLAGQPADMPAIARLSAEFGARVVEDACHAVGATYEHDGATYTIGACAHSEMATFSLHPVKHFTSGEGGLITVGGEAHDARLRVMRTHGISRRPASQEREGLWYYEMDALGFNYRLTDIQAALGRSQLRRIDHFVARRRAIVAAYRRAFADHPHLSMLPVAPGRDPSYHLAVVRIGPGAPLSRRAVYEKLRAQRIYTQIHYIPIHWQPYYAALGHKRGAYPLAERYYEECLSIPCFPDMSEGDLERVIGALEALLPR